MFRPNVFCSIVFMLLVGAVQLAWAADPPAIIIEWSHGSATQEEWVEILVVEDHLDMRGWELTDDNSSSSLLVFGEQFADLRSGTLILVYNYGIPQRDPRLSQVNSQTTYRPCQERLFTPEASAFPLISWNSNNAFGNTNNRDNPILRNANFDIVHDWDNDNDSAFARTLGNTLRPVARQGVRYIGTTAAGVSDPALWQRYAWDDVNLTPGRFNTPEQDAWAQRLWDVACNAATGYVASASPVQVCQGSSTRLEVRLSSGDPLPPGAQVSWEPAALIDGNPNTASVVTRPLTEETTFRATVAVGAEAGLADITVRVLPNRVRLNVFQTPQPQDGRAEILIVGRGGVRPYRYSIDGGTTYRTSSWFRGLGTNRTYGLRVQDSAGCEASTDFMLD